MSLGTFIGGPYAGAYGDAPVGLGLSRDGFRYRQSISGANVSGDAYGDSVLDFFYRGGNAHVSLIGIEYNTMLASMFGFGAGILGAVGLVGRSAESQVATTILMTAIAGTPAVPAAFTSLKSIIEGEVDLEFAARLRECPLTFRLFPYLSSDNPVWATVA